MTTHAAVEDEVQAAYLDGYAAGMAEANRRMTVALDEALGGDHAYGLERTSVSPSGREAIRRMIKGIMVGGGAP